MLPKLIKWTLGLVVSTVLLGCGSPSNPQSPQERENPISISALAGVIPPVFGTTPVTTLTETDQFTGTVSWSGSPESFERSTVYTATISLSPKPGFTLTGVPADFFTVDESTSDTNLENSGVVTAVFPTTEDGSYTSSNIGILKYVPAGTFQREATASATSAVSTFRMSQNEITREQFKAILGVDPVVDNNQTASSSGLSDPVMFINWYHAIAFCNKLSLAEGLTPVYSVTVGGTPVDWSTLTYAGIPTTSNSNWNAVTATWTNNGYRLPTEMEWMWAAMGAPQDGQAGSTNTTGYQTAFSGSNGSNLIGDFAWYGANSGTKTHPAGTKTANQLGLCDLSGNVYEWTWDWSVAYPAGPVTDYRGGTSATNRVLRGGSYGNIASQCTVAFRYAAVPNNRSYSLGFRVVRT